MAEDIQYLIAENTRLRQQIKENESKVRFLYSRLTVEDSWPNQPVRLEPDTRLPERQAEIVSGSGDPPIKGAIPALTYRDKDGKLQISLCRTHAGEGWIYTPVADGWVVITNVNDRK